MKVKVSVEIELKKIPRNYLIVEIPDDSQMPEALAADIVFKQLDNGLVAIKNDKNIIPKELINSYNIIKTEIVKEC